MGCKQPIDASSLPYNITNVTIQSITVTCDYGQPINLKALAVNTPSIYEPELFPSVRLTCFNPLCVNVFHTGKIVITGLKDLDFSDFVTRVFDYILFVTL
jgi:TATA-box binding protein (TBP) (component of TFIID and TFIIIB)